MMQSISSRNETKSSFHNLAEKDTIKSKINSSGGTSYYSPNKSPKTSFNSIQLKTPLESYEISNH